MFSLTKSIFSYNYRDLKNLISRLHGDQLSRGFIVISGGMLLAQAIGMASAPIITRLYTPYDFGVLVMFSSIIPIINALSSFRYEYAILLPKNDVEAANLAMLSMLLVSLTTAIAGVLLILYGNQILNPIHVSALEPYKWLIILGFFGSGLYQVLNYWAIRMQDYRRIAGTILSRSIGGYSVKIFLGLISFGPMGLIIGEIVSQISGCGNLALLFLRRDKAIYKKVSLRGMNSAARDYRIFPYYTSPATLFCNVALMLPGLALAYIYGAYVAGLYGLAYSILIIPTTFISGSISQAFTGELTKLIRDNPKGLKALYLSTARKLAFYAIPSVTIIALSAPIYFPVIFGDKWIEAGYFCLPLELVVVPAAIIAPMDALNVLGHNKWDMAWSVSRTLLVLACFIIAYRLALSPLWALTAYGFVMLITYCLLFLINLKAIRQFDENNKE